ncbi:MAG: hypothetical protein Q9196_001157 [Gyalolechia fulgens]
MAPPTFINNPRTRTRGESDPTANRIPKRTVPRRRASLASLLYDDDYKQYVRDCFQTGDATPKEPWLLTPPLEVDTVKKATEAYHWTHFRLKQRYCTPRSKAFLESYEQSLRAFLETPDDMERKIEIKTMNKILHSETTLYKGPDPRYQDALKAVTELAKLRYYSDYGDDVADWCTSSRQKCVEATVDHVDILIGKSWGQVQTELADEDREWKEWRRLYQRHVQISAWTTEMSDTAWNGMQNETGKLTAESRSTSRIATGRVSPTGYGKIGREYRASSGARTMTMMKAALRRIRDELFFQLTAHQHTPSAHAYGLSQKKLDEEKNRLKHAENEVKATAKKAEAKQRREQSRRDQALEQKEGHKRADRTSKLSGDSWQDDVVDLGIELD